MVSIYKILRLLEDAFGIEPEYVDNWGVERRTDPHTAASILESKGIRIDPDLIKPETEVLVRSEDSLASEHVFFSYEMLEEDYMKSPSGWVRFVEKGDRVPERTYSIESGQVKFSIDNETGLPAFHVPLPQHLNVGEYAFQVEANLGERHYDWSLKYFVCPKKAFVPPALQEDKKIAGIAIALYGVRSERNWGVGDFADLKNIIDWAAEELKVDLIGLNPLHALFNKRPFNSSPYNPSSRLFRNFIYLDVPGITEFQFSAKAKVLVESPGIRQRIKKLREEEHVNYEEVADLKLLILREVFRTFMEQQSTTFLGNERWSNFQKYIESEGNYLDRFATFCALHEYFQSKLHQETNWREWPEAFRNPNSDEVKKFRHENEEAVLFWMFLQWQLDEQLRAAQEYAKQRGMLIGLYNDEAMGVDKNGADYWAMQEFFNSRFRVGAPPDAFSPDGQDWGFSPPNREVMRSMAYEPFLRRIRTSCKYCGALRIDHVMQLHHLFWIPEGATAKEGVYVKDYEDDLLNLVALESKRSGCLIIGEDLGTVPFDFRERLMKKGILSYRIFYFERDTQRDQLPNHCYPENALVSISTHDLPTLAGFWSQTDIKVRRQIGQLDEEREKKFRKDRAEHKKKIVERLVADGLLSEDQSKAALESNKLTDDLHTAVLEFVLNTPSKLVVINQEDLFLDERQQNYPGTTWENPNWVTKMRYSIEELRNDPEAVRLSNKFRLMVEKSGRSRN